jgi:hypothetical protein
VNERTEKRKREMIELDKREGWKRIYMIFWYFEER